MDFNGSYCRNTDAPLAGHSALLGYGSAVVGILLATGLRFLLDPLLGDQYALHTYFLAVIFAAWYGGIGPSLVALVFGTLAAVYFFLSPRYSLAVDGLDHQLALAVYVLLGIAGILLMESQRRAQHRAEASARDAWGKQQAVEREARERERVQDELTRVNSGLVREAAERKRAEATIQLYRDIVANVPIGLTIWRLEDLDDPHSLRLVAANPAASQLTGVDLSQEIGLTMPQAFPAVSQAEFELYADVARSSALRKAVEIHYQDARLAPSYWSVTAFPLPDSCVGLAFENITERKRAEQEIGRLNDQLEERVALRTAELAQANRYLAEKNQENETFVYSVSHDLRSPLVNLEGFSKELSLVSQDLINLLSGSDVPMAVRERGMDLLQGDMAESVRFIQNGVKRLSNIIDALLRLSRAGRVEYQRQQVDLNPVVERVVAALQATVAERGAEVTVRDLPPAWGDPTALELVFANLIGNALNYLNPTRPGRIEVGSESPAPADHPNGDGAVQRYYVKDNGLGIPEVYRPKLFQAFQRLHPGVAKGEGMGLAIVQRIVERHGGKVQFSSTEGGSTFSVELPAPPVDGDAQAAAPGFASSQRREMQHDEPIVGCAVGRR